MGKSGIFECIVKLALVLPYGTVYHLLVCLRACTPIYRYWLKIRMAMTLLRQPCDRRANIPVSEPQSHPELCTIARSRWACDAPEVAQGSNSERSEYCMMSSCSFRSMQLHAASVDALVAREVRNPPWIISSDVVCVSQTVLNSVLMFLNSL